MRSREAIGYWLASAFRGMSGAFVDVLREHCEQRGKHYAITPAQYGVLSLLDHDGELKIGGIAQRLRVDLATVTGIVGRLEQLGLVERTHGRVDRRVVTVALTPEGQDIVASAHPVATAFNERIRHEFSPDERVALVNYLQRVISNVCSEAPGNQLDTDVKRRRR
jgi:MarR family transcriptional regulator, organic hydroperoxide resistance regulator